MARTVGMILSEREPQAEKFVCPHCGKEYKSAAALRTHVKDKHPDTLDEDAPDEEQE